jgi:hypothetical protein
VICLRKLSIAPKMHAGKAVFTGEASWEEKDYLMNLSLCTECVLRRTVLWLQSGKESVVGSLYTTWLDSFRSSSSVCLFLSAYPLLDTVTQSSFTVTRPSVFLISFDLLHHLMWLPNTTQKDISSLSLFHKHGEHSCLR